MKKILILMVAVMALVGCSSGSSKATKTCSMEQNGMKISIIGTAKSEKADIDTAGYEISVSYDAMGIDKDSVTKEVKEQLTEQVKSMFASGLDESVEVETKFTDDGVSINYEMDAKDWADSTNAKATDLNLEGFTKTLSDGGFTCK